MQSGTNYREKILDRSNSPFEIWAGGEGIPIVRGYYIPSAFDVPLKPWKRMGCLGALVILEGGEGFTSAYICEIPPGVSTNPVRHLFEEKIFVLEGKGETKVWNGEGPVQSVPWKENGLFSPPLNVWRQHKNTGDKPAKFVSVTNAPLVLNIYRNPEFVFNDNFVFADRYNNEKDYFDGKGIMVDKSTWKGGLIHDVRQPFLGETAEYGKGFKVLSVEMSENSMGSHLAQIELGVYKKPHRHGPGAHLVIVEGDGCALMWDDWDKKVKADFQKGTIYCPPERWWHTHCNTGKDVVKQVALRCGIPGIGKVYRQRLGTRRGGDMLERDDEPAALRQLFEEELSRKGLTSHMDEVMR